MTILIGVKTEDGAVLAADCQRLQFKIGDEVTIKKREHRKIIHGLHVTPDQIIGGYFTIAGLVPKYSPLDYMIKAIEAGSDVVDYFTDPMANYREAHITTRLNWADDPAQETYYRKDKAKYVERLRKVQQVRAYAESGRTKGKLSSRVHMILRLSTHFSPDLIEITDQESIKSITEYQALGSGEDHSKPVLEKGYKQGMTIDDALVLTTQALNKSLAHPDEFKGYQIVKAWNINGQNYVQTAVDTKADKVDLDSITWLGPKFE